MCFRLYLAVLVSSFLLSISGCTTSVSNSHQATLKPEVPVYVKLENTDIGYRFTSFTLIKPHSTSESAWTKLENPIPLWNITKRECSTNRRGQWRCNESPTLFMERTFPLIPVVSFQEDDFMSAYFEALSAIPEAINVRNSHIGFLSEHKIITKEYDDSKLIVESLNRLNLATNYPFDEQLDKDVFDTYAELISHFKTLELTSVKLAEIRLKQVEELNEYFEVQLLSADTIQEKSLLLATFGPIQAHLLKRSSLDEVRLEVKAHQKEKERLRLQEQLLSEEREAAEQERLMQYAVEAVRNPQNIGKMVCRDGILTYQAKATYGFVDAGVKTFQAPGQITANIEGHSPDLNRVKLRLKDYAKKNGTFYYVTGTTPSLDGISVSKGDIFWESSDNGWYLCS